MRISDWSSDVCSSDLHVEGAAPADIAVRDRPCRASIKSAQQSEHRLGARMGYDHARQERRKEHRQLSIARSERPFDWIARRPETDRLDQDRESTRLNYSH